jgi:hypothetical protein
VLNDRGDVVLVLVSPSPPSRLYASLLGTRRRRRAVTSCGLRAPPLCKCALRYIYMHCPAAMVS